MVKLAILIKTILIAITKKINYELLYYYNIKINISTSLIFNIIKHLGFHKVRLGLFIHKIIVFIEYQLNSDNIVKLNNCRLWYILLFMIRNI